jgi:hypothetical protein
VTTDPRRGERFRYVGWSLEAGELACTYDLDGREFTERVTFASDPQATATVTAPVTAPVTAAVAAAARLVFLLSGVSYYKTGAPPVIDLGEHAVTDTERAFLRSYYVEGLAEFAYKLGLDLRDLVIEGPSREAAPVTVPQVDRPLVPFGGGIDSIVVVEQTRSKHPDLALFVASRAGDRFASIEAAAAVTGLEVKRADREIDPQVLRSKELGFLNGHVPVTGILSSLAIVTALLDGRDSVIMSNEWSASSGTVEVEGRVINHQWSKSLDFESGFRAMVAESLTGFEYFSALRPYSELWVARRLAALPQYHKAFRSCNRSFHLDPALRYDRWCGECDKCCFIDLILSPYLGRTELEDIFDGKEPLAQPALEPRFRSLLGDPELVKPFECVGDEGECRAAVRLAAAREDRTDTGLLHLLARTFDEAPDPTLLQQPLGPHFIPDSHAQPDLLV